MFGLRLCLKAGQLDYREALNAIPPEVLTGWIAFDRLTGAITGGDADQRAAVSTALIASAFADGAPSAADLLPLFSEKHGQQMRREAKAKAQAAAKRSRQSESKRAASEVARIPRHPNAR